MLREPHRLRRRPNARPRETILSNVLGEFLDPLDALFTIFFSILFALLFTLAYDVLIYSGVIPSTFATGYGQELFLTIMGAIVAWGIIDAVLYVVGENLARSERHRLLHDIQTNDSNEGATAAIADQLDFILEPITSSEQRDALYRDVLSHLSRAEPQPIGVRREDVEGAAATLLLYIVAALPSLLPLLLLPGNTALAIRISNVVSLLVVFVVGYNWGIHTNTNPWKIGLLLLSLCLGMVLIAMLLGG